MNLTRISRVLLTFPVTATARDGSPATLDGVAVALLPPRRTPTAATTWITAELEDDCVTVLIAGPDADPTGALVVPAVGADLWARVTDNPEIDAARIGRITVT